MSKNLKFIYPSYHFEKIFIQQQACNSMTVQATSQPSPLPPPLHNLTLPTKALEMKLISLIKIVFKWWP